MEIPQTLQVQMMTAVRDDQLAETVGVDRVLTRGQHAVGHVPLECAMTLGEGRILGILRTPMVKRTTKMMPVKTDTKR
jgi:hypothetical protein